jgi:LAO/AO transport system kinase
MLGLGSGGRDRTWTPPIIRAVSTTGEGAGEVLTAIRAHRAHLEGSGALERRRAERVVAELRAILIARLLERIGEVDVEARTADVLARRVDPWTATDDLLDD